MLWLLSFGFLEQVCVCGTDAALRVQTAFRMLLANASKMYIDIFCILATSGGVHALT